MSKLLPQIKSRIFRMIEFSAVRLRMDILADAQKEWQAAINQLQQISPVEADNLAIYAGKALKIALLVVPTVHWAKMKQMLHPYIRAQVTNIHQDLIQTLSPEWICTWATPGRFKPIPGVKKGYESYPSVSILAKIVPI